MQSTVVYAERGKATQVPAPVFDTQESSREQGSSLLKPEAVGTRAERIKLCGRRKAKASERRVFASLSQSGVCNNNQWQNGCKCRSSTVRSQPLNGKGSWCRIALHIAKRNAVNAMFTLMLYSTLLAPTSQDPVLLKQIISVILVHQLEICWRGSSVWGLRCLTCEPSIAVNMYMMAACGLDFRTITVVLVSCFAFGTWRPRRISPREDKRRQHCMVNMSTM
jgi:hypothetical protein